MHWVPVALTADLPKGVAIPARIGDQEAVVWRSVSGHLQTWGDRCPHRGMRLSHGFVRGETLACIYHGWRYGRSGSCLHIPAHPALVPPETITARVFHAREAMGVIWASVAEEPGEVPDVDGFKPLRSLPVERAGEAVLKKLGGNGSAAIIVEGIAIIVQPTGENSCMLHTLVRSDLEPKAASARLEALRRDLEATA